MLKQVLTSIIFTASILVSQANAAFIPTDWLAQGDQRATLDSNSGLEWLDLSTTVNQSYNTVLARLSSDLSGWRFPTEAEFRNLFLSNFPKEVALLPGGTGLREGVIPNGSLADFVAIFGGTQLHAYFVYGLFNDDNNKITLSGHRSGTNSFLYRYEHELYNVNYSATSAGWFLVSDGGTTLSSINDPFLNINNPNAPVNQVDVTSPAGLSALFALLFGAGLTRRKGTSSTHTI